MKKTFLMITALALILASCGNSGNTSQGSTTTATVSTASKPVVDPGELLIAKSDCVGCHNKEETLIGPAYIEIATKYKATNENITLLASKIIKGGKGVWGPIPMTPHANITDDDAKTMVKYILSLKK